MVESTGTSSPQPRVVLGDSDERKQVYPLPASFPLNSPNPPYNWITKLRSKFNGVEHEGTGFKINLADAIYTMVMTAGYNLYNLREKVCEICG